nr:peptide deformylase [bacterium]
MAVRNILKGNDPGLRKTSRPVETIDDRLQELIDDMIETLHDADGCGLAAPQVGVLKRVVVIDVGKGPIELINPEIVRMSGEQNMAEGCLSLPGISKAVTRPQKVTVKAKNRNGRTVMYTGTGLLARAFCHEIDHLDGVLFIDRAQSEEGGQG